MDIDTMIGERIHQHMWRGKITQLQLAQALGIDQAAVSRRLRGRTAWKVSELVVAAAVVHADVHDLLALPRLDSNQQPAGSEYMQVRGFWDGSERRRPLATVTLLTPRPMTRSNQVPLAVAAG